MQPHATLTVIREEHAALAAMLRSILLLIEECHRAGRRLDFASLRAILFFVDEFPEQRHHRKESTLLFPKLRARSPTARRLLDRLEAEHVRGERAIRDLERALLAYEMLGAPRQAAFEKAARDYADFYVAHMALEEAEVLPLALKTLTDDDWAELDAAFSSDEGRFTDARDVPVDYRALFSRIVQTTPAPVGLGPAL